MADTSLAPSAKLAALRPLAASLPRSKPNSSKYMGVSLRGNKWHAYIYVNGKQIHLGSHGSEEAAARAFDVKAAELERPLNFPAEGADGGAAEGDATESDQEEAPTEGKDGKRLTLRKGKPVYQFDLEGNFIKEFPTQLDAAFTLNLNQVRIPHPLPTQPDRAYVWSLCM